MFVEMGCVPSSPGKVHLEALLLDVGAGQLVPNLPKDGA